jgi:hypothetical protein
MTDVFVRTYSYQTTLGRIGRGVKTPQSEGFPRPQHQQDGKNLGRYRRGRDRQYGLRCDKANNRQNQDCKSRQGYPLWCHNHGFDALR